MSQEESRDKGADVTVQPVQQIVFTCRSYMSSVTVANGLSILSIKQCSIVKVKITCQEETSNSVRLLRGGAFGAASSREAWVLCLASKSLADSLSLGGSASLFGAGRLSRPRL